MKKQSAGNKKVIIGLTGIFGSGKSTVAGILRSYGAEIIDADKIAHRIIASRTMPYHRIVRLFCRGILNPDKSINRKKLGEIVFGSKGLLARLNKIMHPEIIRVIKRKIKASKEKIIVLDAPLLIEAGLANVVDKIIVVKINQRTQLKRLTQKRRLSQRQVIDIMKHQIPLKKKVRFADFIIDNNGTLEETRKQVIEVYQKICLSFTAKVY